MEPDDDLKMPLGQKITIVAVVGLAIIFILVNIFSH